MDVLAKLTATWQGWGTECLGPSPAAYCGAEDGRQEPGLLSNSLPSLYPPLLHSFPLGGPETVPIGETELASVLHPSNCSTKCQVGTLMCSHRKRHFVYIVVPCFMYIIPYLASDQPPEEACIIIPILK